MHDHHLVRHDAHISEFGDAVQRQYNFDTVRPDNQCWRCRKPVDMFANQSNASGLGCRNRIGKLAHSSTLVEWKPNR